MYALPCFALFGFIKDCYLSLSTSACSSFLPAVCTVTVCVCIYIYIINVNSTHAYIM